MEQTDKSKKLSRKGSSRGPPIGFFAPPVPSQRARAAPSLAGVSRAHTPSRPTQTHRAAQNSSARENSPLPFEQWTPEQHRQAAELQRQQMQRLGMGLPSGSRYQYGNPIPSYAPTNAGSRNDVPQNPASITPVQLSPALIKDLEDLNNTPFLSASTLYPNSDEIGNVGQACHNTIQHPSTKRKRNRTTTPDQFPTPSGPVTSRYSYPPTGTGHAGLGISVPSSTPVQQRGNSTNQPPQASGDILRSSHMAWNTDDHQSADAAIDQYLSLYSNELPVQHPSAASYGTSPGYSAYTPYTPNVANFAMGATYNSPYGSTSSPHYQQPYRQPYSQSYGQSGTQSYAYGLPGECFLPASQAPGLPLQPSQLAQPTTNSPSTVEPKVRRPRKIKRAPKKQEPIVIIVEDDPHRSPTPEKVDWDAKVRTISTTYDGVDNGFANYSVFLYRVTATTGHAFASSYLAAKFPPTPTSDPYHTTMHRTEGFIKNGNATTFICLYSAANPENVTPPHNTSTPFPTSFPTSTTFGYTEDIGLGDGIGLDENDHEREEITWMTLVPDVRRELVEAERNGEIEMVCKWTKNMKVARERRFHKGYWLAANMRPLGRMLNRARPGVSTWSAPAEVVSSDNGPATSTPDKSGAIRSGDYSQIKYGTGLTEGLFVEPMPQGQLEQEPEIEKMFTEEELEPTNEDWVISGVESEGAWENLQREVEEMQYG